MYSSILGTVLGVTHTLHVLLSCVVHLSSLAVVQIVDKALEEPKYSSLYAQLCLRLAEDAPNFDGPSSEIQTTQKQSTVRAAAFF